MSSSVPCSPKGQLCRWVHLGEHCHWERGGGLPHCALETVIGAGKQYRAVRGGSGGAEELLCPIGLDTAQLPGQRARP